MKKTFLKGLTIVAMALTLTACGDKVTTQDYEKWAADNGYSKPTDADYVKWATDNGYVKPTSETPAEIKTELEVAFGNEISKLDTAQYVRNLIGGISATGTETVGEEKDLLLFYGVNECLTCDAVKAVLNQWVADTGYKIYYYNADDDTSAADASDYATTDKAAVIRKLGATSGNYTDLTSATLYAFVEGKKVDSISGTADVTVEKVTAFAKTFFSLPDEEITVKVKKELTSLAELRQVIANEEQFIMYNTRFNCPWCRKLADTKRDNAINKIMREYEGNFYTITSEKVLNEWNKIYVTGTDNSDVALSAQGEDNAISVWQYWYNLDNGAKPDIKNAANNLPVFWPNDTNPIQKAEVLLYLVAIGEVSANASATGITDAQQLDFIKEVAAYAAKDGNKFYSIDRNIPALTAVGWGTTAARANTAAISAILSRVSAITVNYAATSPEDIFTVATNSVHRLLFPQYYTGAASGSYLYTDVTPKSEVDLAYSATIQWMNSWKYATAE